MNTTLLDQALAAHGGLERWRSLQTITARIRFGGLAFASKWKWTGRRERVLRVSTRVPQAIYEDFPRPGRRGIFTPEEVRITDDEGRLFAARDAPRAAFDAFRRKLWWDHLDLLYFAGYAGWNYLTIPFLFTWDGMRCEELPPVEVLGERWRRLQVEFPDGVPTHSRRQTFYFDGQYRLRRHDYVAEVIGSWAKAAHYCMEHRWFSGLLVPTRRRVVPRAEDGSSRAGPTLVWIEVSDVSLE
jgi:hypothetical protein